MFTELRRRTDGDVTDSLRGRTGRRALGTVHRHTGARWPGLAIPVVATLGAFGAHRLRGTGPVLRLVRGAATVGAAVAWARQLLIRPWQLTWGATDTELRHHMPGDHLVPRPWLEATRAITIHAPAMLIWPWLRELDVLPLALGGRTSVEEIEHRRSLVVALHHRDRLHASASMMLEPVSEEVTRLIVRLRMSASPVYRMLLAYLLVDRDFARTRRGMLAVKEVAERQWRNADPHLRATHPLQSPSAPPEFTPPPDQGAGGAMPSGSP